MLVDVRTTWRSGCGVGLVCMVLGGCTPTSRQPGDVSMDAICGAGGTDSETRITVTIRNGTPNHLSLVVGVVLGSGDQLAEAISLRLKRPGGVGVERYQYSHPRIRRSGRSHGPMAFRSGRRSRSVYRSGRATFSVDDVGPALFSGRRGRTNGRSPRPRLKIMVGQPARSTADWRRRIATDASARKLRAA
jgi:hypothetical protein